MRYMKGGLLNFRDQEMNELSDVYVIVLRKLVNICIYGVLIDLFI